MKGTSKNAKIKKRRKAGLRNRILLIIATLSIVIGLAVFGSSNLVDAHDTSELCFESGKCYTSIELQKGDTLWEIAETYMDDSYESIDEYISEIKEINNLYSDEIKEGCYLMVAYNR